MVGSGCVGVGSPGVVGDEQFLFDGGLEHLPVHRCRVVLASDPVEVAAIDGRHQVVRDAFGVDLGEDPLFDPVLDDMDI